MNTGVRTEADAAIALLGEYVDNKSVPLKTSAITGLGLAYAGSHREDLLAILLPHVADEGVSMEIASLSALALGFIFVGSGNGDIASTILQTLMERDDKQLEEKWSRYMLLGLALLYLGLQDGSDATIETLRAIEHPISKQAVILVEACSYAGSGEVLKVQAMLHHCDEHVVKSEKNDKDKDAPEEPPKDDTFQAFAVLGIALIAMGEEVGAEMSMRTLNHLVRSLGSLLSRSITQAFSLDALRRTDHPQNRSACARLVERVKSPAPCHGHTVEV